MFKCFWLQNMHVTLSVSQPPPFPPPSRPSIRLGTKAAAQSPPQSLSLPKPKPGSGGAWS